ncbi:MAG TPA: hypothetical protein VMT99_00685 [Candidatus Paceibacterota bacterium]|nr:hypothetical protein [Candidatus Paceibacterota bacterium]
MPFKERQLAYDDMLAGTGIAIAYDPVGSGRVTLKAAKGDGAVIAEASFGPDRVDEAHILYMEATELLRSRAKLGEGFDAIRPLVEKLFAAFRGERVTYDRAPAKEVKPSAELAPNPGKTIEIDVDGMTYERLPVRTRLITMDDTDLMPIIANYAGPHLRPGDILFVSEKAVCIVQQRVVDIGTIRPTGLARFLARNIGNAYGSADFRGFGHGTSIAMQLFIEEAGYPRVLFAAAVAAVTRPLGIRGMFYRICGKRAKSIDCPMSFLILEYAHAAKLAPLDPDGVARAIRERFGCEAVIVDANYRGAFSLGKTSRAITEPFIMRAFRDNPAGQSDEMTPFVILRKKTGTGPA